MYTHRIHEYNSGYTRVVLSLHFGPLGLKGGVGDPPVKSV